MHFKNLVLLVSLLLAGASAVYAEAPQEAQVTINGFEFNPKTVTIKKGGKVVFTNMDSAPHTVAPDKGAQFENTGRMLKNESKTVVFTHVGNQRYYCDIHPSMKGTVKVVQ